MGRPPLRIPVVELLRHPGSQRRVELRAPLEALAVSTAAVPEGAEADLRLELESLSGGVVVTGTVAFPWRGECRRCLEEVEGSTEAEVRETFRRTPDEDSYPLDDDHLDLAPLVRDQVLLNLPLSPLCSGSCPGPDPEANPVQRADAEGVEAPRDPRWAALDQLRSDR